MIRFRTVLTSSAARRRIVRCVQSLEDLLLQIRWLIWAVVRNVLGECSLGDVEECRVEENDTSL